MALFAHKDGQRWVAWTPNGFYQASAGAEDLIGWHLNHGRRQAPEFFAASLFREQFYRPDVLARVLETLDVDKALAAADKERGRKTAAIGSKGYFAADDPDPFACIRHENPSEHPDGFLQGRIDHRADHRC